MMPRTKASLLLCTVGLVPHHDTLNPHDAQMIIQDKAAIINMIKPWTSVLFDVFDDYITKVMEHICEHFTSDVIWHGFDS